MGALVGWGIPEERVKHYEAGIKKGGILMGVRILGAQAVALSHPRSLRFFEGITMLTDEQLERLRQCADGNTLRYEPSEIIAVLVAGGYAKEGIGRVVTVTAKGQHYLRTHPIRRG